MLVLASWNVRTLLTTPNQTGRRRTTLVARELIRYKVEITALSETRFVDKGQLTELCGYTFFCCGRSSEKRREAGVEFATKTIQTHKLESIPEGINYKLIRLTVFRL